MNKWGQAELAYYKERLIAGFFLIPLFFILLLAAN